MKKYAPWVAAVVALIVVVALLLVPQLSGKDSVTPASTNVTATPEVTAEPTATPEVTEAPEATDVPLTTDAPEATDVPEATEAPEATDVPEATEAPTAEPTTAPDTVLANLNGQGITYKDVDTVAQELMYNYSQYGYDFSDAAMQKSIYQLAMQYALQLNMMEQKAVEMGLDTITDEEKAELEKEVNANWNSLVDQYVAYYGGLSSDATDEDKAAARVSILADLEAMGYTEAVMLETTMDNVKLDKVEAEMVKGAEVTDEEIVEAFNEQVKQDETRYSEDVATYEYMTGYYGQTSYYQPAGYRGITHILLKVDQELLTNYQTLVAKLEEQQEEEEEAAATPTDAASPTDIEEPVTQEQVDAAYQAIIDSVAETIAEINAKLAEGVAFADLVAEYGTDPGMEQEPYKSEGYAVHMDSIMWDPAFVQAAFSVDNVGDVAEPVVGNYGVHIVQYTCDIPAGPVELTEEIKNTLRETLLATKENELFNSTMKEWLDSAELVYTAEGEEYQPPVEE